MTTEASNSADIVWGEVNLKNGRKLYLGSYYRTPSGQVMNQLCDLESSLKGLHSVTNNRRDATVILGGDFNLGDISWEEDSVPPGAKDRSGCLKLLDILHNFHLSQLQRETTRGNRLLDLYITNRPALVKATSTVPSISDHDGAIVVDSDILPVQNKKAPRKVFVFSKAHWNKMKKDVIDFTRSFVDMYKSRSVDDNWNSIKDCINNTMSAHIPTKMTTRKNHKPWLTTDIKRMTRKKHRLYRRAKQTGKAEHIQKFQAVKKRCSKQVKRARVDFINKKVMSGLEDGNTKPFWSYIKSLRQEGLGIPSLKVGKSHQPRTRYTSNLKNSRAFSRMTISP